MKRLCVGIFAICFLGALQAADKKAEGSASEPQLVVHVKRTKPQPATIAEARQHLVPSAHTTSQVVANIIVPQNPKPQTLIAQTTPVTQDAPAEQTTPTRQVPTVITAAQHTTPNIFADDRDFDDARTIRDGDGYESDGSTFDDKEHVAAEKLCGSRFSLYNAGYGMPTVCALMAAINKESIPAAGGKRAKIQNTPAFLANSLADINATASAEELDTIFKFILKKNPRLISRHHLSGTRDAAIRHEEAALALALLDEKATTAQAVVVEAARAKLEAEEAKLAACKEKTCSNTPKLAQREATTHAIQALMRVERPQQLFGSVEAPEEEDGASKLIPSVLKYEEFVLATAKRKELLRPTQTPGGAASSAKPQLK